MAKINAKRLLKLADYLETVPRERFDMGDWDTTYPDERKFCGFSGCAIGWAIEGNLFEGLAFDENDEIRQPKYKGLFGFPAVAKVFDMPGDVAREELFGAHIESDPHQVAARIRKFVRNNEKASAE